MTPKNALYRCTNIEAALEILKPDLDRMAASFARSGHDPAMDAEDFAQEARIALIEAWPEAALAGDPIAYLKTVLSRALGKIASQNQSRAAKQKTYLTSLEAQDETEVDPPPKVSLDCLPPEDAALVEMYVVEGRTYREIGEIKEIPFSTVRSRIKRALATLKTHLTDE